MIRTSRRSHGKLIALLLGAAALAAMLVIYLFSFLAIHFTVALASVSNAGLGRRVNARADAVLVGGTTALAWAFLTMTIVVAFLGDYGVWPVGLGLGLPLGAVVGWQLGQWQEAVSWSRAPRALVLGTWRGGAFLVSRPYTVTPLERPKHMVCSGATGTGKSTLVRNLVVQDLNAGSGLCIIDPKDDLIDGLLPHIPESRLNDVILFDAADTERPLGLNPFADVPAKQRSVAASELIAVFRRYFADAWGARLEHVLRNVVLALLEVPGATLADVPRLLLDRAYAQWVVRQVTNPAVREFFVLEYEEVLRRRSDAIEPILNKVGPWLSYPELRNIISQSRNAFELRDVMDKGKVLLVRIPQGVFGEDVSNLLGALIVARVQLAAQSRVDTPSQCRRPFYLYVDEFQNFATSSFAKILTEARAFGVGLVCINQYPEQLPRELQLALAHNAATFVHTAYRKGRYLLEVTRQEDADEKKPHVYSLDPRPPLPPGDESRAQRLRAMSREQYGHDPTDVSQLAYPGGQEAPGEPQTSSVGWDRDVEEE